MWTFHFTCAIIHLLTNLRQTGGEQNMTSQELLISIGEMLEAKISPLREDIREVRQDMSDVKQDICVMKQEMGSMRREIDGMKQDIASLKQDMVSVRQDIDSVKEEMSSMHQEIHAVKEETGSMRSEVSSLREEMDAVKQRLILIETTLENETNRGIRIIAEGHLDLSRKLDDALRVDNEKELLLLRVTHLENEVHTIKERMAL